MGATRFRFSSLPCRDCGPSRLYHPSGDVVPLLLVVGWTALSIPPLFLLHEIGAPSPLRKLLVVLPRYCCGNSVNSSSQIAATTRYTAFVMVVTLIGSDFEAAVLRRMLVVVEIRSDVHNRRVLALFTRLRWEGV